MPHRYSLSLFDTHSIANGVRFSHAIPFNQFDMRRSSSVGHTPQAALLFLIWSTDSYKNQDSVDKLDINANLHT